MNIIPKAALSATLVLLTSLAIAPSAAHASDPGTIPAVGKCDSSTGTYTLVGDLGGAHPETFKEPIVSYAQYVTAESPEALDAIDLVTVIDDGTELLARGVPGDAVEAYIYFDGVGNATALYAEVLDGDCARVEVASATEAHEAETKVASPTDANYVEGAATPTADGDSVNITLIVAVLAVLAAIAVGTWVFMRGSGRRPTTSFEEDSAEIVFTPRTGARAWFGAGFADLPTTLSTMRDVTLTTAAAIVVVGGIAVATGIGVLVATVTNFVNSMGGGFGF